jgi:hypothetical protein
VELIYARWLGWGTALALATLAMTFLLYVLGIGEPLVPPERLPQLWQLPAREFLEHTGAPVGWGWVAHLGWSDYRNLVGVAMLCLVTALCYLRLLIHRGDRVFTALVLAQVLVLAAAASGLLAAGH